MKPFSGPEISVFFRLMLFEGCLILFFAASEANAGEHEQFPAEHEFK